MSNNCNNKNVATSSVTKFTEGRIMRYEYSRKPRKCPSCKTKSVASILYGYPAFSPELETDLKEKRVVLGGCSITTDDPAWQCTVCDAIIFRKRYFNTSIW